MNGRVYDYRLGRFLSVDPIISNPANSQSINPYSYIGNNPLSGVDPTGYDACPAGQQDICPNSGAAPSPKSDPPVYVTGTHIANNVPIGPVTINGEAIPGYVVSGPRTSTSGARGQGASPANAEQGKEGDPKSTANTLPADASNNTDQRSDVATAGDGKGRWESFKEWWRHHVEELEADAKRQRLAEQSKTLERLAREGRLKVDADGNVYVIPDHGAPPVLVGTMPAPSLGPLDPTTTPVYRGGTNMTVMPNEVRLDANGMVRPTHGVSINTDPAKVERFGGAQQVKSLPEGLKIIQRGKDPHHYEIVPTQPIRPEQFQQLLNRVEFH
jgi:hypothetical protein